MRAAFLCFGDKKHLDIINTNKRTDRGGTRKLLSAWGAGNFRPLRLFAFAVSHTVSARAQSLTPWGQQTATSKFYYSKEKSQMSKCPFGIFGPSDRTKFCSANLSCSTTQCYAYGTRLHTTHLKNSSPNCFSLRRVPS